jgi:hypothetical protein
LVALDTDVQCHVDKTQDETAAQSSEQLQAEPEVVQDNKVTADKEGAGEDVEDIDIAAATEASAPAEGKAAAEVTAAHVGTGAEEDPVIVDVSWSVIIQHNPTLSLWLGFLWLLQDDDDYEILDEDDEDEDEDEEDEDDDQQNHKANLAAFYNVRKGPNQKSRLWLRSDWTYQNSPVIPAGESRWPTWWSRRWIRWRRRGGGWWGGGRTRDDQSSICESLFYARRYIDLNHDWLLPDIQGVKRSAPIDGPADVEGTEDGPSDAKKSKVDWKGIGLTREIKENETLYGHQSKK